MTASWAALEAAKDSPDKAMDDGRCSYDVDGAPVGRFPYRACGRMPVVATWYAVQWPSRRRTPISALCADHDRHAQRAVSDVSATLDGRMYQREAI